MDAFVKALETPEKIEIGFWVGQDGIFHDNWDNYPKGDDALTCTCGVSYNANDNTWIVTPWLYYSDCPAIFNTLESARQMFFFWLNWMENLYGYDGDGSDAQFEKDWLAVKSNRSLLMILFDQEGERLKEKLLKNEQGAMSNEQ
jgi:hypothetical protein